MPTERHHKNRHYSRSDEGQSRQRVRGLTGCCLHGVARASLLRDMTEWKSFPLRNSGEGSLLSWLTMEGSRRRWPFPPSLASLLRNPWSSSQPTGSPAEFTWRKGHSWTAHPALKEGKGRPLEPTHVLYPNDDSLLWALSSQNHPKPLTEWMVKPLLWDRPQDTH